MTIHFRGLHVRGLHAAISACLVAMALTGAAQAQQMTEAQKSAMKSSCRSDYMSHCMSVKPGGIEALQCLEKNMANLSPACQTAVKAAAPPPPKAAAAPPPAAKPAVASAPLPAHTAAPPPAKKPTSTKATKTTTSKPAPPQQAAVAPPVSLTAPPPPATRRPNAPIVMTAVIGRSCLRDLALHCRNTGIGDGQKIACLMARGDKLSLLCKAALKITAPVR